MPLKNKKASQWTRSKKLCLRSSCSCVGSQGENKIRMLRLPTQQPKKLTILNQYKARQSNLIVRNVLYQKRKQSSKWRKRCVAKSKIWVSPKLLRKWTKRWAKKIHKCNGKKHQNVIVRFKTHAAWYNVFNRRKSLGNILISPNWTEKRA